MIVDYTCSTYERKKLLGGENSAHKASPTRIHGPVDTSKVYL